jgi:hypothetical protein
VSVTYVIGFIVEEEEVMASATRSTVIAAFRNASDAQAAAADLEAQDIGQDDIYMESAKDIARRHHKRVKLEGKVALPVGLNRCFQTKVIQIAPLMNKP